MLIISKRNLQQRLQNVPQQAVGYRFAGFNKAVLIVLLLMSILTLSVNCGPKLCGTGHFRCYDIYPISNDAKVIKAHKIKKIILLDNGLLMLHPGHYESFEYYNIDSICNSNTIKDFTCYDGSTISNIYFGYRDILLGEEFFCNFALYGNKCCKLDTNYQFQFAFGDTGSNEEVLIDAKYMDINFDGNVLITDQGDNSVKIYDINGNFIDRWINVGVPSRIRIWEDFVYILDEETQSINKYNFQGVYLSNLLSGISLSGVVTFDFGRPYRYWVIADNGTGIYGIDDGDIFEEKYNYCLDDATFNFGNIVDIDARSLGFSVADYEENTVIDFRNVSGF